MKHITWDKVTSFSQLIAIVLFVGVFVLGFFLGKTYEYKAFTNAQKALGGGMETQQSVNDVVFSCDNDKLLEVVFFNKTATIVLPGKGTFGLPQVIAASGARYANEDESMVFWNKGDTAFLTEKGKTTYANCVIKPLPQ